MSKPEFSRAFNLEHAKAGAPFSGDHGEIVQVLKWDRKHPTHPIIAIEVDGDQEAVAFRADGTTDHGNPAIVQRIVMLPLGFIDGKPAFVGDELIFISSGRTTFVEPDDKCLSHCRWPISKLDYPTTQMKLEDFDAALSKSGSHECISARAACAIANAALRHAIDAGQVVLPDSAPSDKLLMKMAETVKNAAIVATHGCAMKDHLAIGCIDLNAIIASVTGAKNAKEGAQ